MGLLSDKEAAMGADHVVWGTDAAWRNDRFAAIKSDYERKGRDPSNRRYGYVVPA